jgi:hypothetical protein
VGKKPVASPRKDNSNLAKCAHFIRNSDNL